MTATGGKGGYGRGAGVGGGSSLVNGGTIVVAGTRDGAGSLANSGVVELTGSGALPGNGVGNASEDLQITGNIFELEFTVPQGVSVPASVWVYAPTVLAGGESLPAVPAGTAGSWQTGSGIVVGAGTALAPLASSGVVALSAAETPPAVSFTTAASQAIAYSSIGAIPAVSVSGTVGISWFGSFVCTGDGISQTFTSAGGGTVDLPGLHAGTGTVTCTLTSASWLHASAALRLTLTPVFRITGLRLIHPTVVWCAKRCGYPDTLLVFRSCAKARIRLLLHEHTRREWRTVATAFTTGHKGLDRRRVAGRWHRHLVPSGSYQLWVQVNTHRHGRTVRLQRSTK
ncbi:MAG: hypothetical protein M0T77_03905 [Actinomycetota bacterium]|nr:hypothetical protein [Actinomycetota bacterium]